MVANMSDLAEITQQALRFPMMENDEYQKAQHQEIKLGKEEGLDVSIYSNPEFNWLQMEQIRMGLKDKLDATVYANPEYNYETMRQIRLSLYSGIDLLPYLKRGFEDDDLEEIRFALVNRLPIDRWLKDNMCAPQIHQIRVGLCEDIDISAYADIKYNWMQMQEIRLGLEKKLDVSIYSNYLYSHAQMREIRLGMESGLDVSGYCSLVYSATDMREKRQNIEKQKKSSVVSDGGGNELETRQKTDEKKASGLKANTGEKEKKGRISHEDSPVRKEFSITIEENGNKAYAYIPWISGNVVTKKDIYLDLERRGIVFGIIDKAIDDLIESKRMNEKILIAEGIPAKQGNDGWFEWFVRLDLPRIPAPLPDGGVDYVNIEAFEMVEAGEKIAYYHRAQEGLSGKNIYGETIHAEDGIEKKPLRGTGFEIEPDGVTYVSQLNGKFEYLAGRIIITNMMVVREDVTAVTGKLEVDGSIYVIGSVYSGGYIKVTGDIIIEHNVQTARLIAGGNVMIKRGSCSKNGCFIDAGGEVSGSFFEAANINAGGNVKANYIMNSVINTMGKVIVSGKKGMLLGGSISAVCGVDTYNLGNQLSLETVLDVGRNRLYEKQHSEYEKKREKLLSDLKSLENEWKKVIKLEEAGKTVPEELRRKLHAAIEIQSQRLAELDGEESKLANQTGTDKGLVIVRGKAYDGSTVILNGFKYTLSSEVRRVLFKLRNKQVVMVTL